MPLSNESSYQRGRHCTNSSTGNSELLVCLLKTLATHSPLYKSDMILGPNAIVVTTVYNQMAAFPGIGACQRVTSEITFRFLSV
jgi:hypothetical protein